MPADTPRVSVLIPVYNGAVYLKDTVESVLEQTYQEYELLLLDDASTDASAEIMRSFSDPRIRCFFNNKNMGISATRNRLLDLARCEYLAVMDNDDLSSPDRLQKQVEFLDHHPDVVMVGSWGELFCKYPPSSGLFGRLKQKFINLGWTWCQPKNPDIIDMLHGNPIMHSSSMLRRSALKQSNICYNQNYSPAEDYDLCRQIITAGWKLANIPQILFHYHYHGHNHSLHHKEQMRAADHKVKNDILNLLDRRFSCYPYLLIMLHKLRLKKFLRNIHD